jgi:hypothetical protein
MTSGSPLSVAVGAGVGVDDVGPRLAGFAGLDVLWQPVTAAIANANNNAVRTDLVRIDCG